MVYHVKSSANWDGKGYPPKKSIEPILFLSRFLTSAETRYWPTELELAGIVWILRKVRHLIESSEVTPTVVFTDHGAALGIARQTSLTTASTDKLNLRLIRASNYIQRFELELRHKPGKQHIVPDTLSRLASTNVESNAPVEGELDALFTATLIEVEKGFRDKISEGYHKDLNWQKISQILDSSDANAENSAKLHFYRENGLIYRAEDVTGEHAYQARRLCIPAPVIPDVLAAAHDDGHLGYENPGGPGGPGGADGADGDPTLPAVW